MGQLNSCHKKGSVMEKKCKKTKKAWPTLFCKRAGKKYTQKSSSAEGEKKDQSADAESSRTSDSKLHDHVMRI